MILTILFWILWILWVIGLFAPLAPGGVSKVHGAIPAILIGILGFKALGNPLEK